MTLFLNVVDSQDLNSQAAGKILNGVPELNHSILGLKII